VPQSDLFPQRVNCATTIEEMERRYAPNRFSPSGPGLFYSTNTRSVKLSALDSRVFAL
jgi:hypothetical protein